MSLKSIIFLSPVIFGLAHVHHFYEFRITHPKVPLVAAIVRSVVQFTYTSLFGAYATFLYLRTGSLLAVIVVHAFCNSMGLPRFWGLVQPYWARGDQQQLRRATLLCTILYYILLVGGLVAWLKNLFAMTENNASLIHQAS
jgi:prenyl protein peptidase